MLADVFRAMVDDMRSEAQRKNRSADERDATQALKDAKLLTNENLQNIMKYKDCLAGGLCWLRNEKLLTQEKLDTILNSVDPSLFAELMCRLAQNHALTSDTNLKFSLISKDRDHLNLAHRILTIFMCRYSDAENRKKIFFTINQLDDLQTAKDVLEIVNFARRFVENEFSEFPNAILDLLTKPENKAAWSGIAAIIRQIRYECPDHDELQKLMNAEIARVTNLPLLRLPPQTSGFTSFLQALGLKEKDKIETDTQLRENQARTIELFFNVIAPKATHKEKNTPRLG